MTADEVWQDAYADVNSIQFQTLSQSVETEVSRLDLCAVSVYVCFNP